MGDRSFSIEPCSLFVPLVSPAAPSSSSFGLPAILLTHHLVGLPTVRVEAGYCMNRFVESKTFHDDRKLLRQQPPHSRRLALPAIVDMLLNSSSISRLYCTCTAFCNLGALFFLIVECLDHDIINLMRQMSPTDTRSVGLQSTR